VRRDDNLIIIKAL